MSTLITAKSQTLKSSHSSSDISPEMIAQVEMIGKVVANQADAIKQQAEDIKLKDIRIDSLIKSDSIKEQEIGQLRNEVDSLKNEKTNLKKDVESTSDKVSTLKKVVVVLGLVFLAIVIIIILL